MMRCQKWFLLGVLLIVFSLVLLPVPAQAASLQEEFDAICIHTQGADKLSLDKLQGLVSQCDELRQTIEKSNDPKKKVLLFRLKKCRDFLAFMVESKKGNSTVPPK